MNPTPEEFDRGQTDKELYIAEEEAMVKVLSNVEGDESFVPTAPMYFETVAAIRKKREEEKKRVVQHVQDPSFDYRWCNPRGERFPYLVVGGWIPVMEGKRMVCDNELILCRRDKALSAGDAEDVGLAMIENKGEIQA